MVTTNVDIRDSLTNGAMRTVANIVADETMQHMNVILVLFDNENVGQEAKGTSISDHIHPNAVPIEKTQVTFAVNINKQALQVTRKQFPLTLTWVVTVHRCQCLTIDESVVDMMPVKGKYTAG